MTKSSTMSPSLLRRIMPATIRNFNDLIRMRGVNDDYAEIVDDYIDEVWMRLLTREGLIEAAENNFTPALEKYSRLGSRANLFPALVRAGILGHSKFFNMALNIINIPIRLFLIMACRFGLSDIVTSILESGDYLDTVLMQPGESTKQYKKFTDVFEISSLSQIWRAKTIDNYDNYERIKDDESESKDEDTDNDSDDTDEEDTDSEDEDDREYDGRDFANDFQLLCTETYGFIFAIDAGLMTFACHSGNEDLVDYLASLGLPLGELIEVSEGVIPSFHASCLSGNANLMIKTFLPCFKLQANFDVFQMLNQEEATCPSSTKQLAERFDNTIASPETNVFDGKLFQMLQGLLNFIEEKELVFAYSEFIRFVFNFGDLNCYSLAHQALIHSVTLSKGNLNLPGMFKELEVERKLINDPNYTERKAFVSLFDHLKNLMVRD